MRQVIKKNGQEVSLFESNKQKVTSLYDETNRHKYKVPDGYLEKTIKEKLPSYDALVWKNFFYGRIAKRTIKNFPFRMSSQNPTHVLYPEKFQVLDQLVDFPKSVRSKYKS